MIGFDCYFNVKKTLTWSEARSKIGDWMHNLVDYPSLAIVRDGVNGTLIVDENSYRFFILRPGMFDRVWAK